MATMLLYPSWLSDLTTFPQQFLSSHTYMKQLLQKTGISAALLFLLVLLTRLPFLFDGYGVEEDSWGLVVNAYEMHDSGHYIASRIPGHPLQEYVYLFMYDAPAFLWNLLSAFFGALAAVFFFLSVKKLSPENAWASALALAFVPVIYIAGTYVADYTWTLAFSLLAFYLLLERKLFWCGVVLGMATGCRITSLALLLPFVLLLFDRKNFSLFIRQAFIIGVPTVIISVLWYIPSYLNHGSGFFGYSDQFAYPPFAKIAYKATLGVFGVLGCIAIGIGLVAGVRCWKRRDIRETTAFPVNRLLWMCVLVVVLYIFSYLRLPQKSAYMIPVVPFVLLFLALTLSVKTFRRITAVIVLSSFIFGINLTDQFRGTDSSAASVTFHVAGQEIYFDPFTGPVFAERSKRLRKAAYCEQVLQAAAAQPRKTVIISGWWYNQLLIESYKRPKNASIRYAFYMTEADMKQAINDGYVVTFLAEQDRYNDEMFGQQCTNQLASPFVMNQ